MGFTRDDFNKMDEQLKKITLQKVEEITVNNKVPTIDDLKDSNTSNVINASILFIDIRKSTELTDISQPKTMVKIYRAFMRMAVDCVRKNNGVTRQFLGDRIMGVFYDETDTRGNIVSNSVDNAVNCARSLHTCIIYSLNKYLKNNVNEKIISCGVGIDYGKVLVTKVGMQGLEHDENKDNEMNCVWVSKATNHASKFADISNGNEIFISELVFKMMSDELKKDKDWIKVSRIKNSKKYIGYCISNYYLDYYNELGEGLKEVSNESIETEKEYTMLVEKLDNKYLELLQKEKQFAKTEEQLKLKEEKLLETERDNIELLDEIYKLSYSLISILFCKNDLIKQLGLEKITEILNIYYEIGTKMGIKKDNLDLRIVAELIDINIIFNSNNTSYDYLVKMANKGSWLLIRKEPLLWAKDNCKKWQITNCLDKRINDEEKIDERRKWIDYKNEILKIWGDYNEK